MRTWGRMGRKEPHEQWWLLNSTTEAGPSKYRSTDYICPSNCGVGTHSLPLTHAHPHTSTSSHMHTFTHTLGNIDCSGTDKIHQAENCHFQRSARDMCNPPAALILQGFNISVGNGEAGICECAYRGGRYVCVTGEWVYLVRVSGCHILWN